MRGTADRVKREGGGLPSYTGSAAALMYYAHKNHAGLRGKARVTSLDTNGDYASTAHAMFSLAEV